MDVVDAWTGRSACSLQAAMRESNEGFAELLGVAVRTVASWHAEPAIVPRAEIQQALDTTFERASDTVRQRFRLLSRPPADVTTAQALRVAIAIIIRNGEVLLVCRRGDASISWQFPAGVVKPGAAAEAVTVQEAHSETGVHCAVRQHIGSRLHPVTGVQCDYFLCDYLAGEASNGDVLENVDVAWVAIGTLQRFIPTDRIYPPILDVLEAHA